MIMLSINKKEVVISVDQKSDIKEINRVTKEIFELLDRFVMEYEIRQIDYETYQQDRETDESGKTNALLNLLIEIYNLCIITKDKGKSKLIELKAEFKKQIRYFKDKIGENVNKVKPQSFIMLTQIILPRLLEEMIKDIKDLEKKAILEEFMKKYTVKSMDMAKAESNRILNMMKEKKKNSS